MTKSAVVRTGSLLLILAAGLFAQPGGPPPGGQRGGPGGPGGPGGGRGPMSKPSTSTSVERALQAGPSGTWWRDAALAQRIGLTPDQQKKIEDAFQQSRLHLIDLTATLEKEQVTMDPLLAADHPDEAKILVQIDRIAQARAELEKSTARMLLGFRNVLTQDQWVKLKAETPGPTGPGPHTGPPSGRRGGPGGPPPGGGR
jgi:Spy/CpxP family protein refolding chaperone